MRYFYDTEFSENGKTIDLISIGVVTEDGRELYLESNDIDLSTVNDWVRQNVLPSLVQAYDGRIHKSREQIRQALVDFVGDDKPEFWGYYSAYDHVALCQLFGAMVDLPSGWPFYTRDIKQLCDSLGNPALPEQGHGEHNALADARWNKVAFDFLMQRQN